MIACGAAGSEPKAPFRPVCRWPLPMAKRVAAEVLVDLRRRLDRLPPRDPERARLVRNAAELYGISRPTLYDLIKQHGLQV